MLSSLEPEGLSLGQEDKTIMKEASLAGGLDPAALRARVMELGVRLIPPDPLGLVPLLRVPPPAPLPQQADPVRDAELLARAYREVGRRHIGEQVHAFGQGRPAEWADFQTLVKGAEALARCRIPPEAWVKFSLDVWREHLGHKGLPRPGWMFSAGRIVGARDWFERHEAGLMVAREVMAPAHRGLCAAHAAMMVELLAFPLRDRDAVEAVVDRHFAGDSFDKLLGRALGEQRRLQRDINQEGYSALALLPR